MNIVLTGLRGSGKTKLGKLLAKSLNKNFIDTDEEIEKHEKKKIEKVIELKGWEYFRAIESKIIQKVSKEDNSIIATGGGALLDPENIKALKKRGKFIYLYTDPKTCAKRIFNKPNRPALTNRGNLEEEMEQLYLERNGLYCKTAFQLFHRTENLERDAKKLIKALSLK